MNSTFARVLRVAAGVATVLAATLLSVAGALAQAPAGVELHLFWRVGCQHCENEKAFLAGLQAREPRLRVRSYEVLQDGSGRELFRRVGERLGVQVGSVPLAVVGDTVFIGFLDESATGRRIEARVAECLASPCPDSVKPLALAVAGFEAQAPAAERRAATTGPALPEAVRLPLLGEVRTANLSLPVLTLLLAAVDGFNPCAMWVLVFLLGLLVALKDRGRMWLLGGAFVVASALVYFLFLAAWLNVFLFIGTVAWIRWVIAAVAVIGGLLYLREFVTNPEAVCKVTGADERRRVFDRLRELTNREQLWLALGGIVALAFAVNVVELICSAGIPAVYTQILVQSALPAWQYYGYLALYILVFMLDDLVVLFATLGALEVTGLTSRYTRWSNLLGGAVLVALGLILVFRPGWLSFG